LRDQRGPETEVGFNPTKKPSVPANRRMKAFDEPHDALASWAGLILLLSEKSASGDRTIYFSADEAMTSITRPIS